MSTKTQEMIAEELETLLLDALDIEEEEEEEEEEEFGEDDDEFDPDEDRGDDVDPDLPDDDDDLEVESDDDGDADDDSDADDLDADDLADLAGEGGDKKPSMIPHARFNEVNEALKKERAERLQLEEELARTRGRIPKDADVQPEQGGEPPAFDFKAKRKELREALYEGNEELAEKLEDEIDAAKAAELERRAETKAQQLFESRQAEAEARRIQAEVQAAATAAMTKYPLLNPDIEGHDPELVEDVVALRDFYIHQKGMSPGEAITKAADKVAGRGAAAKDDAGDGGKRLKAGAKPTTEQLRRNDERSRKIPPRDGGIGERATDIDWENLTEEEFDSLPDSEKRKARGDYVA